MPNHRGHRLEWSVVLALFVGLNFLGARCQSPLTYHDGKGWEGVSYYKMAEQFAHGEPIAEEAPFVFRVGTPFLAAAVAKARGGDLFLGFKAVNLVANAFATLLLVLWLRRFVADWRVRAGLVALFLFQWDAPVRWLWFYPVHTDPWMWVFLLGGLLALDAGVRAPERRWPWLALGVVSALGVLFREVVFVVPVAALFARNPLQHVPASGRWGLAAGGLPTLRHCLPLALGGAALLLVRRGVTQTDSYSFVRTALHWAYDKPWITYAHGWLLAFGPVLFLVLFAWRDARAFLAAHQALAAYLLAFAVLGCVGGTDTERLLYWSMPVVYVLLGRALLRLRGTAWPLAGLGLAQLIACRAFWTTPDYPGEPVVKTVPLFTPLGSRVPFLDLFSFHGTRVIEAISLLEYLAFGFFLYFLLRRRRPAAPTGP